MTLEERITALENRVAELERQVGMPPRPKVFRQGGTETKVSPLEEIKRMLGDDDDNKTAKVE
jgi:hypothetical protein